MFYEQGWRQRVNVWRQQRQIMCSLKEIWPNHLDNGEKQLSENERLAYLTHSSAGCCVAPLGEPPTGLMPADSWPACISHPAGRDKLSRAGSTRCSVRLRWLHLSEPEMTACQQKPKPSQDQFADSKLTPKLFKVRWWCWRFWNNLAINNFFAWA